LDLEAFIAVDSVLGGASFGGMRFSSTVNEQEVRDLAQCMTWKLRGHGVQMGGAKAGIVVDPNDPSLVTKVQRFAELARDVLSSRVILGKDMGATNELLDLVYREAGLPQLHLVHKNHPELCPPGRLRDLCGYRAHMTGLGVAWSTRSALGGDCRGARVLVQGVGVVGLGTIIRLTEMGATIVGVNDHQQALVCSSGLDVQGLVSCVGDSRTLRPAHYSGPGHFVARDALFMQDADVLVLGASSHSVDHDAALTIVPQVIVEGSNFGLTKRARVELQGRSKDVVPDIIASSSSAAMVCHQMVSGNLLAEDELWDRIERAIVDNTTWALAEGRRLGVDPRDVFIDSLRSGRDE